MFCCSELTLLGGGILSAQSLEKQELLTRFSKLVNPSLMRTLKITNLSHSK